MKGIYLLTGLLFATLFLACPAGRQLNGPAEDVNDNTAPSSSLPTAIAPADQAEGDGRFAYVRIKEGRITGDALPRYKYETALRVYNKLVDARGINLEEPAFVMTPHREYVAWMDAGKLEIGLEEKAYDICATFEDSLSAIAALLGHELTHYYEKHHWKSQFTSGFSGRVQITDDLSRMDEGPRNETEADILGGFLAYSAGYQPYNIMPQVLERLYRGYGLRDDLDGYPVLSDRQAIASTAQDMLLNLIEIFETANCLLAAGEYNWAKEYYLFIIKQNYRGREIFNNLGILSAMQALSFFNTEDQPFHYPFQLDLESRISRGGTPEVGINLMREAIRYFEDATRLDREYGPAWLNLAAAHAFLGEYEDAGFFANKAYRLGQKQENPALEGAVLSLRAIMTYRQDAPAKEEALALFRQASDLGHAPATLNARWLEQGAVQTRAPLGETIRFEEQVAGLELSTFYDVFNPPRIDAQIPLSREELFQSRAMAEDGGSKLLMHLSNEALGPEPKIIFHLTEKEFTGQTDKGIVIGDTSAAVVGQYGPPHREIATTRGSILVYNGLMFFLDNAGAVERWAVYFKSP